MITVPAWAWGVAAAVLGISGARIIATRHHRAPAPKPKGKGSVSQRIPPTGLPSAPPPTNTGGHAWALQELPKNATAEREAAIIAAIDAGNWIMPAWYPVQYEKDGHTVTIFAWADCLAIGLENPVRVNVWHSTGQRIADRLDCMLPTSRMSDMAWQASKQINPQILGASAQMSTTAWMVQHSDKVQAAIQASGGGFCRPLGKDWVNTERLLRPDGSVATPTHSTIGGGGGSIPAGANYGWQSPAASLWNPIHTVRVWQSIGLAHDMNYTDYSQTLTLYRKECVIDNLSRSCEEVLTNPDLAYLLSDEVQRGTACRVFRHPAIPAP